MCCDIYVLFVMREVSGVCAVVGRYCYLCNIINVPLLLVAECLMFVHITCKCGILSVGDVLYVVCYVYV